MNGLWRGLDEEDWGYRVDVRLVTIARLAGQTGHTSTITFMTTVPVLTMILTMMTIISVTIITTDTWPDTPPVQRPIPAKRLQVNEATWTTSRHRMLHALAYNKVNCAKMQLNDANIITGLSSRKYSRRCRLVKTQCTYGYRTKTAQFVAPRFTPHSLVQNLTHSPVVIFHPG